MERWWFFYKTMPALPSGSRQQSAYVSCCWPIVYLSLPDIDWYYPPVINVCELLLYALLLHGVQPALSRDVLYISFDVYVQF